MDAICSEAYIRGTLVCVLLILAFSLLALHLFSLLILLRLPTGKLVLVGKCFCITILIGSSSFEVLKCFGLHPDADNFWIEFIGKEFCLTGTPGTDTVGFLISVATSVSDETREAPLSQMIWIVFVVQLNRSTTRSLGWR